MFIISIASVSATDVNDINDNQDLNVLNSYDSQGNILSSENIENSVDSSSSVGSSNCDGPISSTVSDVSNDDESSTSISSANSDSNSYEISSADENNYSAGALGSSVSEGNSSGAALGSSVSGANSSADASASSASNSSNGADNSKADSKGTATIGTSSASVLSGDYFYVTLKDKNSNKLLAGKTVSISVNGKSFTKTTNSNGTAKLLLNLKPGKYVIYYSYAGDSKYKNYSSSLSVKVAKNPTKIANSGSSIVKGKYYYLTLKDSLGNVLSNRTVTISYRGKTYKKTTNSKGIVSLKINSPVGKTYKLSYKYAGNSKYGSSSGSLNLRVKLGTALTGSSSTIIRGNYYYVTLKDANGKALSNKKITFNFNGKTYNRTTNSKGVAKLKFTCAAGKTYKFSYKYGGSSYYGSSSSGTFDISVKLTSSIANSGSSVMNDSLYKVTLKDGEGNALSNKTVAFVFDGKKSNEITDANGVASLNITVNTPKKYSLTYSFAGDALCKESSGSVSLNVKSDNVFTISQILDSSKALRTYVETYGNVPSNVSVNGVSLKLSSFSYLMSKALISINSGNAFGNVGLIAVDANYSNNGNSSISGNLYKEDYILLAQKLANYTESHEAIPNYINSSLGLVSPNLYTFGLSKALQYYGVNNVLPNYLILKGSDVNRAVSSSSVNSSSGASYSSTSLKGNSSQFKKGLNEVANLSSSQLSAYLSSSGYDSLNSAIKTLANSLVSGKNTTWAKASAIFNYVRDKVSYSYYANSRKGASGTLSSKSANCCDQANLVVALCRAANIPARFSHGQGCTFSSGLVTGHVWAQIYVDGVWYSADATSSRNSLGNIHNWNVKSFNSLKQYAHLPF